MPRCASGQLRHGRHARPQALKSDVLVMTAVHSTPPIAIGSASRSLSLGSTRVFASVSQGA
eukprot:4519078-Prymnesium_polylepis.1